VASGIPCNPKSNAWNHLTIQVQRTSDGHLLFKSITLNGYTATLNRYDTPTNTGWYGVTVNYQIDSDYYKTPYSVVPRQVHILGMVASGGKTKGTSYPACLLLFTSPRQLHAAAFHPRTIISWGAV